MSKISTQSVQRAHLISVLPVAPVWSMPNKPDSSWPVVPAVVIEIGKTGKRVVTKVYKIKYPGAADYYNPWVNVNGHWRKAPLGYDPVAWLEGLKAIDALAAPPPAPIRKSRKTSLKKV